MRKTLGEYGNGHQMSAILNAVLRLLQLIAAVVVIGFYGTDLNAAHKAGKYSDSKWVYAVAVGSMSAITTFVYTAVVFIWQYRSIAILFGWDCVLTLFWAIVTGIFGSMYIDENPEMDAGIKRMKTAVGFDIANLILWGVSALCGAFVFFHGKGKQMRSEDIDMRR